MGPWTSLAGAGLFWLAGNAVGVTFADPGLFNFRFWPLMWLLLGLTVGFATGAHVALRLAQRSPRMLGGILVLWVLLTLSATLADSSGWGGLYLWAPGLLLAAAVIRHRARSVLTRFSPLPEPRRRRTTRDPGGIGFRIAQQRG